MAVLKFLLRAAVLAVFLCLFLSTGSQAREIRVGIGFSLPPYVIRKNDSGLEVELIRSAFEQVGFEAKFVYLPNLRLPVAFANGEVDCVCANAAYDLAGDSGRVAFGSKITLAYQNYAISLRKSHFTVASLADLMDKRVLAFNNAAKYLGPEFAVVAKSNLQYRELADQSLQVRMLYSGRVDVVVSDKRIFLWWRNLLQRSNLSNSLDLMQPVEFHSIFPPATRRLHFGKSETRDAFNRGLDILHEKGRVEALMKRYSRDELPL